MLHAGMAPAALHEAVLACFDCAHDSLVFRAACLVLVDNPNRHTRAVVPTGASLGSQHIQHTRRSHQRIRKWVSRSCPSKVASKVARNG